MDDIAMICAGPHSPIDMDIVAQVGLDPVDRNDVPRVTAEANARLIAVAPEMFEMLMELDAWLGFRPDVAGEIGRARVKSLIAKATGEAVA